MTPASVIRTIWFALDSVNQRLPSGPVATPATSAPPGSLTLMIPPAGVMRVPPAELAYQRLPSGPPMIALPAGQTSQVNSVMVPSGVMRPSFAAFSVNHMSPSGPAAMETALVFEGNRNQRSPDSPPEPPAPAIPPEPPEPATPPEPPAPAIPPEPPE